MPDVVKVYGVVEVRRALARLATEAPRQIAFVNLKAAKVVAGAVVQLAPQGPHEGGGSIVPIAQSIGVSSTPLKAYVTAGGPKTPHAAGAEWGGFIPRRGFKSANRRAKRALRAAHRGLTRLHRHSFLMPAVGAKTNEVVRMYESMIDDLIARFERD